MVFRNQVTMQSAEEERDVISRDLVDGKTRLINSNSLLPSDSEVPKVMKNFFFRNEPFL